MKQQVFVIGRELSALVPYGLAFGGSDFSVTLVQAADVVERATALAAQHEAWYLLLLDSDDDADELQRRLELSELPAMTVDEFEDPVVAMAHLVALSHWDTVPSGAAEVRQAEEQYG
jgi:hypothetical protein